MSSTLAEMHAEPLLVGELSIPDDPGAFETAMDAYQGEGRLLPQAQARLPQQPPKTRASELDLLSGSKERGIACW